MLKLTKGRSDNENKMTVTKVFTKLRHKVFFGLLIGVLLILVYPAAQALHPLGKTMKNTNKHSITLSVKSNSNSQVGSQQNSQTPAVSNSAAKASNSTSVNVSSNATSGNASPSSNTSCNSTIVVNGQVVNSGSCANYSQVIPDSSGQTDVSVQQNSSSSNSSNNSSTENIQVNSDSSGGSN